MKSTSRSTSRANAAFSVALVILLIAFSIVLMQWANGVDRKSSPSQNLKGSNNGTEILTATKTRPSTAICLVSVIDVEIDDGKKRTEKEEEENEIFVCNLVSEDYTNGVSDEIMYIRNMAASMVKANQAAINRNEWFIEFEQEWLEPGRHHTGTIIIPDHQEVQTIEPATVPHHHSVSPSNRRRLTSKLDERRRRLSTIRGNRTVIVVAVELTTVSNYMLYDHFFGANNSLVTQMNLCSQGQVRILPHPEHPIIKVSPSRDVSHYTFVELYTHILNDIKRELNLNKGDSITSVTDHLFLVVPDAIDRRPGELGWGATPGFFAGTVESLSVSRSTMTLLHELGHNFGLGHAYEDHVAYSDMSTVMGYSHRNVVKMCYNGHNYVALGWYKDRTYDVKLSDDDQVVFDLAFYGDYSKTNALQPVIARYDDAYFTFNRKRDMNLETKEYGDMLLIVQEFPGEYHAHTNLEQALAVGDNPYQMKFKNNKDKIFIEVCSYSTGNLQEPDTLRVAVSRKQNNACLADTRESVAESTKLQPSDCGAVRPWVEVQNPEFPDGIQIQLCASIASNPDEYCNQIDDLSHAEIWKICRFECPQSGCADTVDQIPAISDGPSGAVERNVNGDPCQNKFSWVEVEEINEYGDKQYVSRTCAEMAIGFLAAREKLCNKHDTLTRLPVYEVCQVECPTGCGSTR